MKFNKEEKLRSPLKAGTTDTYGDGTTDTYGDSYLFYFSIISFCIGIFIRHQFDFGWSFLGVGVLLITFILSSSLSSHASSLHIPSSPHIPSSLNTPSSPHIPSSPLWRGSNIIGRRSFLILFLIITFFFLGYLRLHVSLNNIQEYYFGYESFIGTVVSEPDARENSTHYVVSIKEKYLKKEENGKNIDIKVRITLGQYPILNYGDVIELEGVFEKPENFKNPKNGIEFDYRNFLLKDDIQFVSYFPKVEKARDPEIYPELNSGQASGRQRGDESVWWKKVGMNFKEKLFKSKSWFINNLNKSLPSPHSSLAGGILVGAKQSLGEELLEDFRKVGLIHIVVLSGYNVTIIIDAIQKALSFLPRTLGFSLSIFSIISFAVFTGASATTVRASIMATLIVISRFSRRTYGVNRALFLAGFFMVLHNPRILMSDPGFQLSFVATLGLLHISPKIELVLSKIKYLDIFLNKFEKFEIKQIISATISTQISVLPLLISMTGEISVVALLANLLVLPVIPISMAFSAISGLVNSLGIIFLTLSFSIPTYWLLEYVLLVTNWLAGFSFATFDISL